MVGASVAVRKVSDGSTITTVLTDANGLATIQANGHYEPFFLFIGDVPGGDKYWRSDDAKTAGVLSLPELPAVLRAFGDGVIRGYGNALAVTLVSSGPTVSVASGAANVAGHPFVVYSSVQLSNTRPSSGVRTDRVILRLYPAGSATTPGKADVALLQGTVDAGTPALTTSSTVHEVSLYQVSVPAAGAITLTDERLYAAETPPTSGVARSALATTTNASGEALTGLSVTLTLPRPATYHITADLSAVQTNSASVTAWVLQATYGSLGSGNDNFNTPGQVAVDATHVYIADTVNNRIVKRLLSTGAYVASFTPLHSGNPLPPVGVAVDAAGRIYVHGTNTATGNAVLQGYTSAFALDWFSTLGGAVGRHLATNGTYVYYLNTWNNGVRRANIDGTNHITLISGTGSGDGQFNDPFGICLSSSGASLYIVDRGNSRIQRIGSGGTYLEQWGSAGTNDGQFSSPRGIARDIAGNVWVADTGNDRLQRFAATGGTYQQTISQANPDGIGIATGDVLWVSNADSDNLAKWDEVVTPGGHGQIAIEIDGSVSAYTGFGLRDGSLSVVETGSEAGPGTCLVRAFGKRIADTMTLKSCVLSARATPRS